MSTEALTMSQDDLFHRLRAAYLRGAKWKNENVLYTPADVEKAAYDYADAVVSPLNPTVEKVETPAQGTPAPESRTVVTDEMVEAACRSYYRWYMSETTTEEQRGVARSQVRTIVNAALLYQAPPQTNTKALTDTQLLDALASNYWDLRCVDVPTGGDDADIDWVVIEHHQGKPSEVEVDRAYRDDPRIAIRRALRASDKNAARCVSCDEVLHDGDSVYYEHGEGGHIHSWCASDDPESFVDEDEVPLKAGDEIQKPFAYSVEKYEGQP